MVALKHYREHVRAAVEAGADVVICGAGLPLDLPELVEGSDTKISPIVSSARACKLILKQWDKKYHRTADFIVVEGPAAGGHLGFHPEKLEEYGYIGDLDAKDGDAVKGDTENGLVFCGAHVGRINRIMHVSELMQELAGEDVVGMEEAV